MWERAAYRSTMSIRLEDEPRGQKKKWIWAGLAGLYGLMELSIGGPIALLANPASQKEALVPLEALGAVCPQSEALAPSGKFKDPSYFLTPEAVEKSVQIFSGAIQIPTESFDGMAKDPLKDDRFKIFAKFHKYLFDNFPLLAKNVETVNTYGLLFTIQGTDEQLKPIILMAHQDVVPVNPATVDLWEHPPFSGFYDGEWIYGRGSIDTKNSLLAVLEASESLLSQGWVPERTVLISFGFDEEVEGKRGAGCLASFIENRYGKDSIEAIIDEGSGLSEMFGALLALPSTAEKGLVDIKYTVNVPGGHSSMPPDHTGIGILSDLITVLEANPFEPHLSRDSVMAQTYSCLASAPDASEKLRDIARHLDDPKYLNQLLEMLASKRETRYLLQTSQAVDVIQGGIKINALPESSYVKVDHRVSVDETTDAVFSKGLKHAAEIAKKYDLGLIEGEKVLFYGHMGNLTVEATDTLAVAPKSPTSGEFWDLLTGVNKHVFNSVLGYDLPVITAPVIMSGNTDTANYWNLTHNIYRYGPMLDTDGQNAHTVNEKLRFSGHSASVIWFYEFLQLSTVSF